MLFLGEFLRAPARMGSICPSSRFLARALAHSAVAGNQVNGLIVDLGAGTGVVSRELLGYGIPAKRILAVDISEYSAAAFKRLCPDVELCTGDARNLARIIGDYAPALPVQAIISSLPLRSIRSDTVAEIMFELWNILHKHGGTLIQYTYAVWLHSALERFGFILTGRRYAPVNIPPALVEKYSPRD